MAKLGVGLVIAACGALWAASCTEDGSNGGGDGAGAAGEAGANDSPVGGSAGHAGSEMSTSGRADAGAPGSGGAGSPHSAGWGGGGAGTSLGGANEGPGGGSGEGGTSSGGAGGADGGMAGDGGGNGGLACETNQFAVLGDPSTCVDCGTYHYTAYPPDIYEVCDVHGTNHFYDRPTRTLYIEAKEGLPAPQGWSLSSDPFSSGLRLYTVPACLGCLPPPVPACAADPFTMALSASGKYLVGVIPEAAAACAASAGTPIEGWLTWAGIDYGCAGHVSVNNSVWFNMNLEATQAPAYIDCINNLDQPPKKVDGPI